MAFRRDLQLKDGQQGGGLQVSLVTILQLPVSGRLGDLLYTYNATNRVVLIAQLTCIMHYPNAYA